MERNEYYSIDFKCVTINKGAKIAKRSSGMYFYLICLFSGELSVNSNDHQHQQLRAGELVAFSPFSNWKLKSFNNVTILIFRFYKNPDNINNFTVNSLEPYFHKLESEAKYLKVNEELKSFFISLVDDNNIQTNYINLDLNNKNRLLSLLKTKYKKEDIIRLLYPTIKAKCEFESIVWSNYMFIKGTKEFAMLVNCSEFTFKRKFAYYFAETYCAWKTKQRSKSILDRLMIKEDSLKQIYTDLEFTSASSFCNFCKRNLAASPSELRMIIKS